MRATVVITTKNRKADLRSAIASALLQSAEPEILVIDDGSTDGTAELVRQEFPTVRFDRSDQSLGLIAQRNRAAGMATGEIIFSIDDDAVFSTPDVIEQTLKDFDHPRIAVVAIPCLNGGEKSQGPRAGNLQGIVIGDAYVGTAHAMRKDIFQQLGGYRAFYFRQMEELDFGIRLLNAGYVTRVGGADPIHHFESPIRDMRKQDMYSRRNDILWTWYNVPWPYFPLHLIGTTYMGLKLGFRLRRPLRMLRGSLAGYMAILSQWQERHPVRGAAYRLQRQLRKSPMPLAQVESVLPPLAGSR